MRGLRGLWSATLSAALDIRLLLEEQALRALTEPEPVDLLSGSFPEQCAFVLDFAPQQAAMCPRRAAKSYSLGLKLFDRALRFPRRKNLYIGLTRESARGVMWSDIFKAIDRKFQLGVRFHETLLEATFTNGSMVKLLGLDANEKEQHKVLGQKYQSIVIDEAASFTIDLELLVKKTLTACVADYRGEIILAGTASNFVNGYFHKVTTRMEAGWSHHSWLASANPHTRDEIAEQVARLVANNPGVESTPWFQQMYLNRWVIDESALIYKFDQQRNTFDHLPVRDGYRYILGCDMGYEDDSAFVVLAYHAHDPVLYCVHAFKQRGMDLTDFANKVKALDQIYKFEVTVCDGAAKQAVMELNNRQGLRLIAADKTGKMDFIEVVMNTQLTTGRLKLARHEAKVLADEWLGLVRDPKSKVRAEHPNCPNHASDAALYGARYCYSYLSAPPQGKLVAGSPEWFAKETAEMEERAVARVSREKAKDDEWNQWGESLWQ